MRPRHYRRAAAPHRLAAHGNRLLSGLAIPGLGSLIAPAGGERRDAGGVRALLQVGTLIASNLEAGRDEGHPHLAFERRFVHGAEDDLGVVPRRLLDHAGDARHLVDRQVVPAGDVQENPLRAMDRDVVQERRLDRLAGGEEGAVLAPTDPGAEERGAARRHDGAYIREVHIHLAVHADQVADPLRGLQQHLVGVLERLPEGGAGPHDLE